MTVKEMGKYRSAWMGLAILWVVFFHAAVRVGNPVLNYIKYIGYSGVDIFLFAAGYGNYFSYTRTRSASEFLKKRIIRLAPSYLPFIVCWITVQLIRGKIGAGSVIGNLTGTMGFSTSGIAFNWYLTALVICYLLTPFLAETVERSSFKRQILLVLGLFLISTVFLNDRRFLIAVSRLPVFCIGMIFARNEERILSVTDRIVMLAAFLAGHAAMLLFYRNFPDLLWSYGLYWYPFILVTPFACLLISQIAKALEKTGAGRAVNRIFDILGKCSFELFLVHIFMFDLIPENPLAALACTAAGTVLLRYISGIISRKITK